MRGPSDDNFAVPYPDYPCKIQNVRTKPSIHPTVYVSPSASLTGAIWIGEMSSVWHGVTMRGDFHEIRIGSQSNIQDGACLHNNTQDPCILGDRCSVGHLAIVHGARIEDDCLIGMGAIVMNGVVVGAGSIVGAGALVLDGMQIPPGSLVLGNPAKVRGPLTDEQKKLIPHTWKSYVNYSRTYLHYGVKPWKQGDSA